MKKTIDRLIDRLIDQVMEKEIKCPTLCIDCPKQCSLYKTWLNQLRKKGIIN